MKCIDIKFFKSQFDRIKTKEINGRAEYLREIGIAPPSGTKIKDWKFWEVANEGESGNEKCSTM